MISLAFLILSLFVVGCSSEQPHNEFLTKAEEMVFEKSVALLGWEVIGEVCAANCGAHGKVRETDCLAQAAALAALL